MPPGANLILQTRTGDTVESITRYYKKNGDQYPGTEEEAAKAWETDKKFFGGCFGRANLNRDASGQ